MDEILKEIRQIDIKTITDYELEQVLPRFGMNNENLNEMPKFLTPYFGKGVKFWQYPNQFSKYLKQLSLYNISSYLEIGCRWGGTFIITSEILKGVNPNLKMFTCDLITQSDILSWYSTQTEFKFINKSSFDLSKEDVQEQVDLILIDGDHSYDGVKRDYEICKQFNPKYVVFHDITNVACTGVSRFWDEIKRGHTYFEYTDQYPGVGGPYLGIGLLVLNQ